MKQLNIEISEELHKKIKIAATHDGETIKEWAAAALACGVAQRQKDADDTARLSSGPEAHVVAKLAAPGKPSASTPSGGRAKRAPKKH